VPQEFPKSLNPRGGRKFAAPKLFGGTDERTDSRANSSNYNKIPSNNSRMTTALLLNKKKFKKRYWKGY
jgi:hypothetical protein